MSVSTKLRNHEFGSANVFSVQGNDALIVDIYSDQYSVNWSTRLNSGGFLSLWRHAGIEKARAVLLTASSEFPPIEGYAYQLFNLLDSEELEKTPAAFIRLWLDDASVAWQILPGISDESEKSDRLVAVVGLASNRFDYENVERYFRATATEPLIKAADDLLSNMRDAIKGSELPWDDLGSLTAADFH